MTRLLNLSKFKFEMYIQLGVHLESLKGSSRLLSLGPCGECQECDRALNAELSSRLLTVSHQNLLLHHLKWQLGRRATFSGSHGDGRRVFYNSTFVA